MARAFEINRYKHSAKLLHLINEFRKDGRLCDVILKVGTMEISTHRAVLAASSPYFRAMFTTNMAEATQDVVTMKDIDPDVLDRIVEFIYTGHLDVTVDNVQDLLAAASLIQLESVQEICCEFLKEHLEPANCLGIRNFAEANGCTQLTEAVDVFARERFVDVYCGDEFLSHPCEHLISLISSDELNVTNEKEVYLAVIRWVKHDPKHRAANLPELLRHIRLPVLPTDFLIEHVDCEELIRSKMECRDIVDEAKRYHLVKGLRQLKDVPPQAYPRKSCVGKLFAVGGKESSESITRSVECYNNRSNSWSREPDMIVRRQQLGVGVLKERLYAVGGSDGSMRLSSVECYDPGNSSWAFVAPMNTSRSGVGVGVLGGAMYASGGYDGRTCLNTVERYDIEVNVWSYIAPMTTRRSFPGVSVLNDKLFVVGGNDGSAFLCVAECYDPHLNRWTLLPPLNEPRAGIGTAVLSGRLYVAGGNNGTVRLSSVESYDPNVGRWELMAPMNSARDGVCVATIGHDLVALGGINGPAYLKTVERYDPRANQWELITNMEICRAAAGVAVLENS